MKLLIAMTAITLATTGATALAGQPNCNSMQHQGTASATASTEEGYNARLYREASWPTVSQHGGDRGQAEGTEGTINRKVYREAYWPVVSFSDDVEPSTAEQARGLNSKLFRPSWPQVEFSEGETCEQSSVPAGEQTS